MASKKYEMMVYISHSMLEYRKKEIIFDEDSTVDGFRKETINNQICNEVGKAIEEKFQYEVSWHQMLNAIQWFLSANNKTI